ncbi:SDR family NAD(P)-dependent oxidoreductase [Lichenicoccus sp.]|uniref:SDR family NAD(P)-dependent oxidoreductase n=1 Tax=Lichenicoccus sp. TaxID=2781899 RepID=UPI003D09C184
MRLGHGSTADDVLSGVDLRGLRVLITGISSGIGLEMARALTARGAAVVGTMRDSERRASRSATLAASPEEHGSIVYESLDLASLSSVRACADRLLHAGLSFDAIVANAGVMAVPKGVTNEGFETHMGVNYLGHFAFVNRLRPLIGAKGRVVSVSSAGHRGADVELDDLAFERMPYDPLVAYRRSKTALILFAVALDRRERGRSVRATAVHPGAVLTNTARRLIADQPNAAANFSWKSPAQGAATPLWAAFAADSQEAGGRYCEDCHVAGVIDDPSINHGVRSYALDQERAEKLWRVSAALTGEGSD